MLDYLPFSMDAINKVAIQGIAGSFHHQAAVDYFGEADLVCCASFEEELERLAKGEVDFVVMAIENTLAGGLMTNYQLLLSQKVFVVGEITLPIRQHLIGKFGQSLNQIREVHSHPVALHQCKTFLRSKGIRMVENEDTAQSVQMVALSDRMEMAAIGSQLAADIYGLEVLQSDIHGHQANFTRFLVLSAAEKFVDEANKVSVYCEVSDSVGSLAGLLGALSDVGVNLSMIHSFPKPDSEWVYGFFVDFSYKHANLRDEAFAVLGNTASQWRVLGIYSEGKKAKG